jgi:hypothetical protein
MSGSAYGKGPYGKGLYSSTGITNAAFRLLQPSRVTLSGGLVPILQGGLTVSGPPKITLSGALVPVAQTGSAYGKGLYGMGKYSRAPGVNYAAFTTLGPSQIMLSGDLVPIDPQRLQPIQAYTRIGVAGTTLRVGFHVIEQPDRVQLSGATLWQKVAVPPCAPWFFVGQPASWVAMPNSAGAMFP